jgi:hypothetical protein
MDTGVDSKQRQAILYSFLSLNPNTSSRIWAAFLGYASSTPDSAAMLAKKVPFLFMFKSRRDIKKGLEHRDCCERF